MRLTKTQKRILESRASFFVNAVVRSLNCGDLHSDELYSLRQNVYDMAELLKLEVRCLAYNGEYQLQFISHTRSRSELVLEVVRVINPELEELIA